MSQHFKNSVLLTTGNVVAMSNVATLDEFLSLTDGATFDVATLSCVVVTLT